MFFLPVKIETIFKTWPVTNWLLMLATSIVFLSQASLSDETLNAMVLSGWSLGNMAGHLFLHAGLIHLGGNLVFLWVFGNAICGNTSNFLYPLLYLFFGTMAAVTHLCFSDAPAIGASGAINGVVGMALAMYPINHVKVFWFVIVRAGFVEMPLWVLALIWFAFDLFGALSHSGDVAYWAHLGGFVTGLLTGMLALKKGWVTLTRWDNDSLLEIFTQQRLAREV